jgi:hypothetical protein
MSGNTGNISHVKGFLGADYMTFVEAKSKDRKLIFQSG